MTLISREDAIERIANDNVVGGMTREEAIKLLKEPNMVPIKLEKRYPESRVEDITDAFMQGYLKGKEAVQGYTKWLEKIIVEAEIEWLCEDTTDEEWCKKNCDYTSIQAECLRHLYEASKGGETE